jgi:hypothetical protein
MTYEDALLQTDSYPTPTTADAIDEAVALAASLGSRVTALAIEVEIPDRSNRLADYLIGMTAMTEAEEAKSWAACRDGLAAFERSADARGIAHASVLTRDIHYGVADHVARVARTSDLCLLPLAGEFDDQVELAQAVVFSSGRPILIFQKGQTASLANGPDLVLIACDGSRNAARAMADAMPILTRAIRVRLPTILNDKPDAKATLGPDAQRHLRAQGTKRRSRASIATAPRSARPWTGTSSNTRLISWSWGPMVTLALANSCSAAPPSTRSIIPAVLSCSRIDASQSHASS